MLLLVALLAAMQVANEEADGVGEVLYNVARNSGAHSTTINMAAQHSHDALHGTRAVHTKKICKK